MSNEIIKGMKFHHIALMAEDYERSLDFYTNGLGLRLYATWGSPEKTIAMLEMGDGGILELFSNGGRENDLKAGFPHLAFEVDDVDAAYERAVGAGAKSIFAPKRAPLDSSPVKLTLYCAFVEGPSGEQLEFFRILSAE